MLGGLVAYVVDLAARVGNWSYLLLFFAAALESAAFLGLLIPGETIVLAAGFLAAQGVLDLDALIVAIGRGAGPRDTRTSFAAWRRESRTDRASGRWDLVSHL